MSAPQQGHADGRRTPDEDIGAGDVLAGDPGQQAGIDDRNRLPEQQVAVEQVYAPTEDVGIVRWCQCNALPSLGGEQVGDILGAEKR